MIGWCPRHDRVYSAEDGRCPDCGTSLVAVPSPRTKEKSLHQRIVEEAAEEPAPSAAPARDHTLVEAVPNEVVPRKVVVRTGWLAIGVLAVIGVSFLAGLAYPRSNTPKAKVIVPREVRTNRSIGVVASSGAGVDLRLDSFEQAGRHVVIRVSVVTPEDFDVGRIRSVDVSFDGVQPELVSIGNVGMAVRTTTSGFIAEGEVLPAGDIAVKRIEIGALELAIQTESVSAVDLSKVWPVTVKNQPRATSANVLIDIDPTRKLIVTGLVGWLDRLEMKLEVTEGREGWNWNETFSLAGAGGTITGEIVRYGSDSIQLDFLGLDPNARRVQLVTSVESLSIQGNWSWGVG